MSAPLTTGLDRFLLITTIVLMPLEDHISSIAGFSILWIIFAVIAVSVLVRQPQALTKTFQNPVFLTAYLLLLAGASIESFHPKSSYREIARIGQMIVGAILVASLCRDKKALRAGLYGYLIAGVWLSGVLVLTSYGALSGITMADGAGLSYAQVTQVRTDLFRVGPLQANLNLMALFAAQGAVVALALVMMSTSMKRRLVFSACFILCLIATFLPLSRGGVAILIVGCAFVMFCYGIKHAKTILIAVVMLASITLFVPDVVWSRMTFSMEKSPQNKDGRARVYIAAKEHLREYIISGVGAGNFSKSLELRQRLSDGTGLHNGFLQVTVYWGFIGLLTLIAVVWQVWRIVPRGARNDELALCLLGISVTLLGLLMVIHNLYSKQFAMGLGLLVGARIWIWRDGKVRSNAETSRSLRRDSTNKPLRSFRYPRLRVAALGYPAKKN